jgi:hypothetical protein
MFAMFSQLFSEMWMFCCMIFGHCDVLPSALRNVDVVSQDFFDTFAMSSWLFSQMWRFCRIISGHICDVQAAVKGNVDVLSHDLCKNTDGAFRRKKIGRNLM